MQEHLAGNNYVVSFGNFHLTLGRQAGTMVREPDIKPSLNSGCTVYSVYPG